LLTEFLSFRRQGSQEARVLRNTLEAFRKGL